MRFEIIENTEKQIIVRDNYESVSYTFCPEFGGIDWGMYKDKLWVGGFIANGTGTVRDKVLDYISKNMNY
jgi:hypothetical protein